MSTSGRRIEPSSANRRKSRQGEVVDASGHRAKRASRLTFAGEKLNGVHRTLSTLEEDFIYAAEFGDIPTVKRILDDHASLNVDFCDILGRTPLRLAVGNEHLEVVELLLDRSNLANIHEALLQAISAGHEQIAESILKHPKYRGVKKENKRFGETDYFYYNANEDSPFSSDITPLILAAERNQFEIVQLLLLRGETISKPHHYYCNCQECSNKLQFDQLRLAKTRLNAYRGLASGAYISLSSKDPILTAFELARELRGVAKVEKYYKNEYLALADQLSVYVVKLLDKVRGHDELEVLINKTGRESDEETYDRLARLKLAIQYNEKKFVAHPSCQQKLVSIWYSDLRALERSNWFFRSLLVLLITAFYPLLCIVYWLMPKSKLGLFLRYPCIKFVGHTMSFFAFLVMIVTSSMTEHPSSQKNITEMIDVRKHYIDFREPLGFPDDFKIRAYQPQAVNIALSIWIVGMLWMELKQIYGDGVYNYFDALYNYLDFAVLTLYITSFTLRYVGLIKVNQALSYFEERRNWESLQNDTKDAREQFYWLIADRYYWEAFDPHNVAEGLFAIANVISFARVTYILPANELFGPMQISLARMIGDILKFGAIFSLIFLAFMVGLHNLYWYYPEAIRKNVEFMDHNLETPAGSHFGTPNITFRTVFWSLFGRGEYSVVELKNEEGQGFDNAFTETIGYWIFGVYNIATVIVLLNMLIAMMSRSFEMIQAEADTEWKFSRSKLYMEYIKDDSSLPIPFNIVPTPKSFYYFMRGCCRLCQNQEPESVQHPGRVRDIEMFPPNSVGGGGGAGQTTPTSTASKVSQTWDEDEAKRSSHGIKHFQQRMQTSNGFVRSDSDPNLFAEKLTYKRVMKRIVKRYIFDVQRENDANEGDFDEIKQDISSFRYEMLNQISLKQRADAVDVSDRVEKLSYKVDGMMYQQRMLIKLLHKHSSIDSGTENDVDSELTSQVASPEGTPESSCSEEDLTPSYRFKSSIRAKKIDVPKHPLDDIPEEFSKTSLKSVQSNHGAEGLLQRQAKLDEGAERSLKSPTGLDEQPRVLSDVQVHVQISPDHIQSLQENKL